MMDSAWACREAAFWPSDRSRRIRAETLAHLSHHDDVRGAGARDAGIAAVRVAAQLEFDLALDVGAVVIQQGVLRRKGLGPRLAGHPPPAAQAVRDAVHLIPVGWQSREIDHSGHEPHGHPTTGTGPTGSSHVLAPIPGPLWS